MDLVVVGLIRQGADVLLQRAVATEEREDPWALPGGNVGEGEFPHEALARVVRKAMGIEVEIKHVVYLAQVDEETRSTSAAPEMSAVRSSTLVLALEADFAKSDIALSNGNSGAEARFMPLEDALSALARQPLRSMAEPVTSYLSGEVGKGSAWFYRRDGAAGESLISSFPSARSFGGKVLSTGRPPTVGIEFRDYERRRQIVVLGCVVLLLALVLLIVVGIIALSHRA